MQDVLLNSASWHFFNVCIASAQKVTDLLILLAFSCISQLSLRYFSRKTGSRCFQELGSLRFLMLKLYIVRDMVCVFEVIFSWCSATAYLVHSTKIHRLNLLPAVCHSHKLIVFYRLFILIEHFLWKVSKIHSMIRQEIFPPSAVPEHTEKLLGDFFWLIMALLWFSNVSTLKVINQSWNFHFHWQKRSELEILLCLVWKIFNLKKETLCSSFLCAVVCFVLLTLTSSC